MNGHPTPPPQIEPQGFLTGIRPLAVALGTLVDNFATLLLGGLVWGVIAARSGGGEGLSEEALRELAAEPGLLVVWMVIGSLCTGLGGFAAARTARCHAARHGAFVGLTAIAIGLLSYHGEARLNQPPLWFDLLAFALLVPVGALGGWASKLLQSE